ncbi:GNAT family N-acetyltransferase [Oscillospiraceae bacterium OttesenSCG-928-F05]|nr:GNAT family N-acetyltransferase [Oscillospiraceae bacterium OttesenSCG-928-F05]
MTIREARHEDLLKLLELYTFLHDNTVPPLNDAIEKAWADMVDDPHHHIIVGVEDGMIISSCVLTVIPNLTHNQRPYALIENVITHPKHRGKGHATKLLDDAKKIAMSHQCYKIMLMTGSKKENTLAFYKRAGYNMNDKTAFIQWLE